MEVGALCLVVVGVALLASFLAYKWFSMLWLGPQPQGPKAYGEDRRRLQHEPFEIPANVKHTERYWQNKRGGLHYVATWEPTDQPPRAVVLQCVGYGDSNTFLPVLRANRLAQRGLCVIGKDYAGMGRSDGLHAYVPCFKTLVEDMWHFFLEEVKAHPTWGRLPVFVLGESMGGNVGIQMCLKDLDEGRNLLHGAILLAPMVTIKKEMKPPQVLIDLLKKVAPIFPTLPVSPTPDVLQKAFRRREILDLARRNPYSYTLKPRLGTALQLLEATDYVTRRMPDFAHPFLVLQGMADVVTDPALAKAFHDRAASEDREIRLYEGFWHSLTAGELEENIDRVFADIFAWLDRQLAKPQLVPTVMTPTSLRAAMAGGFGFGKKAKSKGKLDDGEKEIRRSGSSKGLKQRLGR